MQLTVAVVAGAHGLKGHVRLVLRTDDPGLRLQPGVVLDTDDPDLPELTLAEVRPGSWQVRFEEVSGRDAAEAPAPPPAAAPQDGTARNGEPRP